MIRQATVITVGKLKGWADEGCEDYLKRLRRYFKVEVIEVPEEDMNRNPRERVLAAESGHIAKRIPSGSYVISLDREGGKELSSEKLAGRLSTLGSSRQSNVTFLIGGPLGLSPELLELSAERISFGRITLPHALARVVLLEQLYRAAKISRGEKYHW